MDSLKAFPDCITRMEEQWRDTLREVQRFTAHADATMMDMRTELLAVKKAALRDDGAVWKLVKEAGADLDVQRNLSADDDQLRELKERVQKNDEKHQRSYEKLLDSIGVLNVAQERKLEMLQSDSAVKCRPSRSPTVQPSAPGDSATSTREQADQSRASL